MNFEDNSEYYRALLQFPMTEDENQQWNLQILALQVFHME